MTRWAFADVETTGTDPVRHVLWEAALIVRDGEHSDAEHHWFVKPDLATADPMALRVGKFYERTPALLPPLSRKQGQHWSDPAKAAAQMAALLDGAMFTAANPAFDAAFFAAFLRRQGHIFTADYHYRDVGSLVAGFAYGQGAIPPKSPKLMDVAFAVGIDVAKYDTHTALGDARLARDICDRVTAGRR